MKIVIKHIVTTLLIIFLALCAGILVLLIMANNAGHEVEAVLWLIAAVLLLGFLKHCQRTSSDPISKTGHLTLSAIAFMAKILNLSSNDADQKHKHDGIGWHTLNQEWHIGIDDPFVLHDDE